MSAANRNTARSISAAEEPTTVQDDTPKDVALRHACCATLLRFQPAFWPMLGRRLKGGCRINDASIAWGCCEEMVIGQQGDLRELAEMDNTAMREFGVPSGLCEDLNRDIVDYLEPTEREG